MIQPLKTLHHSSALGIAVLPQMAPGSKRPAMNSAIPWKETYSDHNHQNYLSPAGKLNSALGSSAYWKSIAQNIAQLEPHC